MEWRPHVAALFGFDPKSPPQRFADWEAAIFVDDVPKLHLAVETHRICNAIVHQGWLDPGVEVIFKPFTYSDLAFKMRRILDS